MAMKSKETFGQYLRKLRIARGFGLRAFSRQLGMDAANLSNIERGKVRPPRSPEILEAIAEALALPEGNEERQRLFDLAVADRPERMPADVAHSAAKEPLIPLLLRTVANKQLGEKELRELIKELNERY
jgi:transcriptional regulator with XRE-family HTH domain